MENSREAFKDILVNALSKRYLAEIRGSDETDAASSRHYREMGKILSHRLSKKGAPISYKRRALIALFLAAAILLLGGFGVMAYEEIGNMIRSAEREIVEYYYEDHFRIHFYLTEPKSRIEETYALTYVPEGYELVHQENEELFVTYIYRNKRETLKFSQNVTISNDRYTLLPIDEYRDFTYNGVDYFYTKGAVNNVLQWKNESYVFKIRTSVDLSEEEILKLIDGVQLVED